MNQKQKNIIDNKQMRQPKTWVNVDSPPNGSNFFKFEKLGDTIEGLLMSKYVSSRYGFGMYTIKTFDGIQKRFHGSSQLDDLLLNIDIPSYVRVIFIDNQETPNGTLKLFEVALGKN